jgi:tetratricopeptide (TPR) repeat protein
MQFDNAKFMSAVREALQAHDTTAFVDTVKTQCTMADLCRMLDEGDVDTRRVAAIALGLIGDQSVEDFLFRALKDEDRQVNKMAEHGLWAIWFKSGKAEAMPAFKRGVDQLESNEFKAALTSFKEAAIIDPNFAEAYNQCSIVYYMMGKWDKSLKYCQKALAQIPRHFGAMAGLGHCYTQKGDFHRALTHYRMAHQINPNVNAVLAAIERLQARVRDANDSSDHFAQERVGV